MRRLALLVCFAAILGGCARDQRYSFEHREDGLWRYDHVQGEVHIMRSNGRGWEKVTATAPVK